MTPAILSVLLDFFWKNVAPLCQWGVGIKVPYAVTCSEAIWVKGGHVYRSGSLVFIKILRMRIDRVERENGVATQ